VRREGTAAYYSHLTSYVALWAFRGVGCAPKSGGLRTNGRSCVALRAKAKQPYARSAPSTPPPLAPPAKAPVGKGGQAVSEVCY